MRRAARLRASLWRLGRRLVRWWLLSWARGGSPAAPDEPATEWSYRVLNRSLMALFDEPAAWMPARGWGRA